MPIASRPRWSPAPGCVAITTSSIIESSPSADAATNVSWRPLPSRQHGLHVMCRLMHLLRGRSQILPGRIDHDSQHQAYRQQQGSRSGFTTACIWEHPVLINPEYLNPSTTQGDQGTQPGCNDQCE